MKIKCVFVGDGAVGKMCLVRSYVEKVFPTEYVPTVFEVIHHTMTVESTTYELELHLTAGQEDYDSLRPLQYPNTDVFVVCFSVSSCSSYTNVKEKWVPEARRHCPKAPILLVGTKTDERNDSSTLQALSKRNEVPLTVAEGDKLANQVKAVKYIECSAKKLEGLDNVFEEAILAATQKKSIHVKCVFVGDGAVGKMCLVRSYVEKIFPTQYIPTVFEVIHHSMIMNNEKYNLEFHLTAGQEDYDRLRPLQYPQTDVFVVCFSVSSCSSYTNVKEKWVPEARKYCPKAPILLVGTKTDERNDSSTLQVLSKRNEVLLTVADGDKLAKQVKAIKYIECSAKKLEGLDNVIKEAILAAKPVQSESSRKNKCKVS